jgi:hypothetical protein
MGLSDGGCRLGQRGEATTSVYLLAKIGNAKIGNAPGGGRR